MAVNKLTKRWLYNSFGVILVIVISLVVGFAFGVRSLYYSSVRQNVLVQAGSVNNLLVRFSEDTSADFMSQIRRMVETFEMKNKMEVMALDANGGVILTSSGFEQEGSMIMPDYDSALASTDRQGEFIGPLGGENVLAITILSPVTDQNLSGVRFVVSLTNIDRQIVMLIMAITFIGMAIMFFVILSSSYFINSIVIPVGEVGETARRIAQGDFQARLSKKNDDEIGELCDTINNMAQELSVTEQMKNDFISSVSHELRTPLTAIKGWGETLQSSPDLDNQTLSKGMHVILGETERLSGMVEELLDFSRMQSGRMVLSLERLDIVAELSDAVLMYTQRAAMEDIRLYYQELEDIVMVEGDRNRLRQVFVNILDNALKYCDAGDSVTVTGRKLPARFVVTIADTGRGISPEDLPNVKEKFYKGKSSRRGSGIGLAVADEIVSMHHGSLDITSQLDVGTTVSITLPIYLKQEKEKHE